MRASRADAGAGLVLGAILVAIAFTTTGGYDSSVTVSAANTWTEILLVLLGAGAGTAALLTAARAPAWGVAALVLFALLCLDTALSILWSVQPDDSWQATNLTVGYLGAFTAAVAMARLTPARWPALLVALATVTVAICGYAVLAKVLPGSLAATDLAGRLQSPLGYWNAIGAAAVVGLPAGLWLLSGPGASRWPRVLAVPVLALLSAVLVLCYSRTDAVVGVIVLGAWLAVVPGRLRALALLAPALVAAGVIVAWALAHAGVSGDNQTLALRTSDGHVFGVVVVIVLAAAAAAALAIVRAQDRLSVPETVRQRIGRTLIGLVALCPVLLVVALAASSRGLTGEISHAWHSLTNANGVVGNGASRLGALSSTRPLYWSEGITVGEHALFKGAGALGYATARTLYTSKPQGAEHAHSYLVQTFADLGLLGLAITLALLLA